MRVEEEPLTMLEKALQLAPEKRETDVEDRKEMVMQTQVSEKAVTINEKSANARLVEPIVV